METTNKNKKAFPIASILFLLYVVVSTISQTISIVMSAYCFSWLEDASTIINEFFWYYYDSVAYRIEKLETVLITIIAFLIVAVIIGAIGYILMAFSTFKTTNKPSIVYIVAIPFAIIAACICAITAVIILTTSESAYYIASIVFDLLAQLLLILTLVCVLTFAILMRAFKKPSELSRFWPIFCTPGYLYIVLVLINKFLMRLYFSELDLSVESFSTLSELSFIQSVVQLLGAAILVIALFCVTYQFAKVNKNLPTD